jgi:hypothetical protein
MRAAIIAALALILAGCLPQSGGYYPPPPMLQPTYTDPNIFQAPPVMMPMTTTCYPGMGMVRCSTY